MRVDYRLIEEGNSISISIKIRAASGCYHREHSPTAYALVDEYLKQHSDLNIMFEEHESGPEIIVWLALGTAGLTLTKSVIDLVTAVINARAKGREKGDTCHSRLLLVVRDTHRTTNSTEEIVLEIYDKDILASDQVRKAIEKGLQKKFSKQ